jgi:hypothetical protein
LVPEITTDQMRLAFADEGTSSREDSDAYR